MKLLSVVTCMVFGSIVLSGCESTGGIIGGLIPAPKFTKGSLDAGVYTSKDRKFAVASPFEPGSNEYTYMEIKESYLEGEAHIMFLSSVRPAEVYRVDVLCEIAQRPGPKTSEELGTVVRARYFEMFSSEYGTPLVPEQVIDPLPGELNYVQAIPQRKSGRQELKAFTAHHASYSAQGDDCVGNIWVNYPEFEKRSTNDAEKRKSGFLRSLRFL
ncbi:MAG: hypothetical protein IPK20_05125 [Betaproteobacteria bacterium]|nr:hypothetical protein [Betaproteobacteria bacterium]